MWKEQSICIQKMMLAFDMGGGPGQKAVSHYEKTITRTLVAIMLKMKNFGWQKP